MTIKNIYKAVFLLSGVSVLVLGCQKGHPIYEGPEYLMFPDTLYTLPVMEGSEDFDIPVVSMHAASADRTFAVEVVEKKSSAIEGLHYEILDNTVTIPAGERVANVRIHSDYDALDPENVPSFHLALICDNSLKSDIGAVETKIELQKCKAFDAKDFTGYCLIERSTWFDEYMAATSRMLLRTEADPAVGNVIILRNFIYQGHDIRLEFGTEDPLSPSVTCEEQVFANTGEAFGTLYGDGNILMKSLVTYPSYYNSFEKFVLLYSTMRVDGVGTVGTFGHILRWISDDEAAALMKEGIKLN